MTRTVSLRETRHDAIRAAIAFAVTGSSEPYEARAWATARWGEAGTPHQIEKAADAADIDYLDSSTSTGLLDRELIAAVRQKALLFRMRGVRRTSFRTRSITVSGTVATFVAEGQPIPVLKPTIDNAGLAPAKCAALSVWTKEALEASPDIEAVIFADLARAYADALDFAMLDLSNDGSGVAPAALTYGGTSIASTSGFDDDLAEALAAFSGNLAEAVWLTTPQIGAGLSDGFSGRDIGARGGELAGIPVLTSQAAPDGQMTLIDPGSVMAAWDQLFEIQTSEAGTVEMVTSASRKTPRPALQPYRYGRTICALSARSAASLGPPRDRPRRSRSPACSRARRDGMAVETWSRDGGRGKLLRAGTECSASLTGNARPRWLPV